MANIKISELTAKGSPVSTNDLFETSVSGTATNSVTGQNFVDLVGADNLASIANDATARTNIGAQAQSAVLDNTTASFTTADETKLDGIEASADVTDTANVTSAGAAMLTGADFTGDISTTGNLSVSGTTATVTSGTGTPEGSKTAAIGSVFMRTDGTTDTSLYKKETGTGNTGWVAVASAAASGETLAQTLALGNTSGANDLLMAAGQKVTTNTIDETTAASGVTIDSVLVKDSTVTAGTLTIGGGTITDSSGAISFGNENLTTTGNLDANGVEFDSLSGTGGVAITDILDEDNMASDSATKLATQQSIKAYVDASSGSGDITAVIAGTGISGGGTSGDVTITNSAPNIVQTTVTGNAGTATTLQTARTIAGVSFDGSANISLNNNAITNGAGYTTNTGDITGVTAGTGISGGGTSGTVTITNSSPNATHTGDVTGATELTIASGAVETGMIADDAVTADKLANSINSEIAANTAKTGITSSQASEITANTAKVTNATHTGEVTGSTALTIADNIVDEANLKVSNAPTNGYFLSAQSGNTGGLTWAAAGGGGGGGSYDLISTITASGQSSFEWTSLSGYDTYYLLVTNLKSNNNNTSEISGYITVSGDGTNYSSSNGKQVGLGRTQSSNAYWNMANNRTPQGNVITQHEATIYNSSDTTTGVSIMAKTLYRTAAQVQNNATDLTFITAAFHETTSSGFVSGIQKLKIQFYSGVVSSGEFSLYGVTRS